MFIANRRVSDAGQPLRDHIIDTSGSGKVIGRMPGPDEVLSFELPPFRWTQSGAVLPDQFSVRVKMRRE